MWVALFLATVSVTSARAQGVNVPDVNIMDSNPDAEQPNDDATARVHFEAGQNHYEEGRYDEAVSEFEAALAASPRSDMLYNLYLACERAGRLDEAVGYLERYVAEGNLEQADRDMLNARLENLRHRADAERDASPPMTRSDGGLSGATLGMITSFAVAGAGAVLFGTFAALSEAEDQSLADECAPRCSDDQVADLGTFNLLADIGIGVASAGVVAGLVFLIVELASGSSDESVALRPYGAEVSF